MRKDSRRQVVRVWVKTACRLRLKALSFGVKANGVSSGFRWTRCRSYALDDLSFGRVVKRHVVRLKRTLSRSSYRTTSFAEPSPAYSFSSSSSHPFLPFLFEADSSLSLLLSHTSGHLSSLSLFLVDRRTRRR